MEKNYQGYVVYSNNQSKELPIGIVSNSYEINAKTNYIPKYLKEYLIQIEDRKFYNHSGIDYKSVLRAIVENLKAGKIVQGGSSITQQLARNLLRDNSRTLLRKIQEAYKTHQLEKRYSKDEILELYFNNVYFGKNLRGIRSAGLYYFKKEPHQLSHIEFLALLTILRGPNYYTNHPDKATSRFKMINNKLLENNQISKKRFQKNSKVKLEFNRNPLPSINTKVIPFIFSREGESQKIIRSTIDIEQQAFANNFIKSSKYPVSIIAIKSKKVIAFASTYGGDYPFISKTNVGSTLKPFLYCHLLDSGISPVEMFNAHTNDLDWHVREVGYFGSKLNLDEALFHSNNNAFLNACEKSGMQASLQFLSEVLRKDLQLFYHSSILGAVRSGISLYELAIAYSDFFDSDKLTNSKIECLKILNKLAKDKLELEIQDAFLKTGTTNNNEERIAVIKKADITYAILRNENPINDDSKDGGFLKNIAKTFKSIFIKPKRNYKWS